MQGFFEEFFANQELFLKLIFRLLFACFCGGIIGLERSIRRKDAGIKTHIILALGAALFMIVSQYGFGNLELTPEYRADATRIASNIVTGVSFLCAGVIFVRGASVKGLTTATGIWTCAGIGMAAGAGMYLITLFATVLILIIQLLLAGLSAKIETHYSIEIELDIPENIKVDTIVSELSAMTKSPPHSIKLAKDTEGTKYKVNFNIIHTINVTELIQALSEKEHVTSVSWNSL